MSLEALVPELTGVFTVYELFIKHFDENEKSTLLPSFIKTTHIHLYERVIEKIYEPEYETLDAEGNVHIIPERRDILHISDPSFSYDEKVTKDIDPILFRDVDDLNDLISTKLKNDIDYTTNSKSIFVTFFGSEESGDYNIRESFITMVELSYKNLTFDLSDKKFIINSHSYNIDSLSIYNTKIEVFGHIILDSKNIHIESCIFHGKELNEQRTSFPSISFNGLNYELVNNKIEKDNFIHFVFDSSTDDETLWRTSSLIIMGLTLDIDYNLIHLTNSFIKITRTYNVQILKTEFYVKSIQMRLINIKHVREVEILNFDFLSDDVIRSSLIVLDSVGTSLVSNVDVRSKKLYDANESTRLAYVVSLSNTHQLAEHKFTNFDIESIGLFKTAAVKSRTITMINCVVNNHFIPFNIDKTSFVFEIKFFNIKLTNVDRIDIDTNTISFSECDFKLNTLKLLIRGKLYIQQPQFAIKTNISFILLDGPNVNIDGGKFYTEDFHVLGDSGTGKYTSENTHYEIGNAILMKGLEKIVLSVGRIVCETLHLHALKIFDLSSHIRSTALKKVILEGAKLDQSEIRLSSTAHNRVNIELENCTGEVHVSSEAYRNYNLLVKNSKVRCLFKYPKLIEDVSKVDVICEGGAIGSAIFSLTGFIKILPQSNNENFKHFYKVDSLDVIKKSKLLKTNILYGNM